MTVNWSEDHPSVIEAKGKAKEAELAALKGLTPVAQVVYAFFEGLTTIIFRILFYVFAFLVLKDFILPLIRMVFGA